MKHVLLAGLVALTATPVNALSCLRPNLGKDVNTAIASDETFALAVGTLKPKKPFKDPNRDISQSKRFQSFSVDATIQGGTIGKSGLVSLTQPLTVSVNMSCIAGWCGRFPKGDGPFLMFLQKSETGWQLAMPACAGGFYRDPTKSEISSIAKCISRGKCSNSLVQKLDRDLNRNR